MDKFKDILEWIMLLSGVGTILGIILFCMTSTFRLLIGFKL